ncbi:hypothetical protein JTB14_007237 [Gonioctena quinquepunctata]|nr:hypothetical protein JTB14_007237 [Gonioctena quinquepunctata]
MSSLFDPKYSDYISKAIRNMAELNYRKREIEIERAQLLDYQNSEIIYEEKERSLGDRERGLAVMFGRFRLRGKLNRNVPVVVNNIMICDLDTLLKFRNNASAIEENKYLFGRCHPHGLSMDATLSANESMTELKGNVPGAKNTTTTKLRKHFE